MSCHPLPATAPRRVRSLPLAFVVCIGVAGAGLAAYAWLQGFACMSDTASPALSSWCMASLQSERDKLILGIGLVGMLGTAISATRAGRLWGLIVALPALAGEVAMVMWAAQ